MAVPMCSLCCFYCSI